MSKSIKYAKNKIRDRENAKQFCVGKLTVGPSGEAFKFIETEQRTLVLESQQIRNELKQFKEQSKIKTSFEIDEHLPMKLISECLRRNISKTIIAKTMKMTRQGLNQIIQKKSAVSFEKTLAIMNLLKLKIRWDQNNEKVLY
jgi:DNA-binding phage protein